MIPRRWLVRIAPLWLLCIVIGSFISGKSKEAIGTYTPYDEAVAGNIHWQHRLSHFAVFGTTAMLLMLIARTGKGRAALCLASILFGVAIELGQWKVFGLGLEWWDIRDDTWAALAAAGITSIRRIRTLLVS